jgi:hypothetical protein
LAAALDVVLHELRSVLFEKTVDLVDERVQLSADLSPLPARDCRAPPSAS